MIRPIAAVAFVALFAGSALAAPLNLSAVKTIPDINSAGVELSHTAASDTFTAVTFGANFLQYEIDGVAGTDASGIGVFNLSATIDDAGNLGGGGLTITQVASGGGTDIDPGPYPAVLLTATPTDLGFSTDPGTSLEFLLEVTGGSVADDFGGVGATIGIILSPFGAGLDLPDVDPFGADIPTTGTSSDTFAIPTPASLAILAPMAMGVIRRRRSGTR